MNIVWVMVLATKKEFQKFFYDVREQRKFLLRCKHSKKVMITGYTWQNEEEREYLECGV